MKNPIIANYVPLYLLDEVVSIATKKFIRAKNPFNANYVWPDLLTKVISKFILEFIPVKNLSNVNYVRPDLFNRAISKLILGFIPVKNLLNVNNAANVSTDLNILSRTNNGFIPKWENRLRVNNDYHVS